MLHELVTANQDELIRRCRKKAAKRFDPAMSATTGHGVPLFLQQVIETLRCEQATVVREAPEPERTPAPSEIGRAAALHGAELRRLGYSVDQVVHEYGDVCQAVTEIAVELRAGISADEFRTLNRCLDNAIADAVTSYTSAHQLLIDDQADSLNNHLTAFSHEHERLVQIAIGSYSALRTGNVGVTGATGLLLMHTLSELLYVVKRALPEIRRASETTRPRPADTSE